MMFNFRFLILDKFSGIEGNLNVKFSIVSSKNPNPQLGIWKLRFY